MLTERRAFTLGRIAVIMYKLQVFMAPLAVFYLAVYKDCENSIFKKVFM
jgi:hypothetical protein